MFSSLENCWKPGSDRNPFSCSVFVNALIDTIIVCIYYSYIHTYIHIQLQSCVGYPRYPVRSRPSLGDVRACHPQTIMIVWDSLGYPTLEQPSISIYIFISKRFTFILLKRY